MSTASAKSKPPLTITQPACLVDGSDAQFRQLIHAMVAFSARLLSVRDGFGTLMGITGIQYSILVSIAHQKPHTKVTINKVASHLHLSGPFVTIETGKLHKMGLVEKTTNPKDKREVLLAITPEGRKLFEQIAPDQQKINDVLFEGITAREFKTLCSIFERMVDNGDRASMDIIHLIARQSKA
ncbi:MAG: MarR family transcriptional regulator [Pigmentiphaga sp.]|uniref:MarR family winged helix-turn-helix transcriptional regulator n=1 Tax=Pigmentiphaga sp. TaxID=1977564 RepID=UPI0029BDF7FB|nr:MarR family transcriptional regulator [Pigmentiphaga sp.]MDX3904685.1 MarR family transcriptional regulator [Pigmentiphaga sp.]